MRAGEVGRVDLLNKNLDRLGSNGKWTVAEVTSAMNAAATQDVRAIDTVPLLAQLMAGTKAPNARDEEMLRLLEAWNQHGGNRLDLNNDGKIDDPGAAVMDVAWPKIADAFMSPVLGPQLNELSTLGPGLRPAAWRPVLRLVPVLRQGHQDAARRKGRGAVREPLLRGR